MISMMELDILQKEEAKKEVDNFQQSHPNWIVQIKEISFDKK